MDELVCLQCGKTMEQDWAPCPHCGWKAPESWEEPQTESPSPRQVFLAKPIKWIKLTAWVLLALSLAGFLIFKF